MISLYIAQSLDGYIAGLGGELDFLERVADPAGKEDYGYGQFLAGVDVVVMGRRTWDFVRSTGTWHYPGKQSWVLTRQKGLKPVADERFAAFDETQWRELGKRQHVWVVGGGEVNQLFLQYKLFDRLILSTIPVLLGNGLSCFPHGFESQAWRLVSSRSYPSGLVQSEYQRL